ncbi:MAG: hypothetical protein BMS9Abin20_0315 [Acidimicrobiia bacterium]|nr:MAG: hypothetical protein BMS9Abin20_0315 [Acidimicrobiia bacterium]
MCSAALDVAHRRGLFGYDERIAMYYPNFGTGWKQDVAVRWLFSCQERACAIDEAIGLDLLGDPVAGRKSEAGTDDSLTSYRR